MSDTSGATDVDADMPGIGAATGIARGSPVQLPSALQGLAQHFRQMSQGRPNPQNPQPGQPQRQKPPPIGPTDPPDRAAYAYAPVPANRPRPPPSFTPFVKSMPRDPSQWGEQEAFPRLPQSFELPGIFQQIGRYFAQTGTFATGPMGAGMAAYSAAYQDAFQKGQAWKMKMAGEQLKLHREQLADQTEAELTRYSNTYDKFYESADGDLNKMASITIGGLTYHDALYKDATEIGDKDVIEMIEHGDSAEKIHRFLMDREANLRDLQKANSKAAQEDAAADIYGLKPRGGETTDPFHRGTTQPATPEAPGAPAEAGAPAAPSDKPAPSEKPAKPGDEGEDADNIADPQAKNRHDAAVEVLKGYEPKDIPANALPFIGVEAHAMRDKIGKIINDANSGKIARDQIIPEIRRQVGGDVANDAQSVLDYKMPGVGGGGQGGGTGGKEGDYLRLLGNAASVIRPNTPEKSGWSAANYQAQERFRTDVNTQTVILRSNSLAADAGAIMADLKELERQGVKTTGLNLQGIVDYAKRDPTYAKLAGDWLAYNDAFNTIVSAGRHTATGAEAQVAVAPVSYASPAAFRATIKGHMNDALGYLDGEHRRWETIGGNPDNMPSDNPKTEKELRDFRDMDYLTGTLPGQTYTNKNGVTKTWKGGNLNPYDPSNWQ